MTVQTLPPAPEGSFYKRAFGDFTDQALSEIRRETYGEDLGQNNWSPVEEFRQFAQWLQVSEGSRVLDVCSGSGGPALFLAKTTGCHVTGVDIHPDGLLIAQQQAIDSGLQAKTEFINSNVCQPLPFPDGAFDALWCIDSVIHITDRLALLREWRRLLKPGGRFLYTDPTLVTGMLSKEEIVLRGTPGYFLYSPLGLNERLIDTAGLRLEKQVDLTQSVIDLSERWYDAREKRKNRLIAMEGDDLFERMQRFLTATHQVSIERRLSRFAFIGYRP